MDLYSLEHMFCKADCISNRSNPVKGSWNSAQVTIVFGDPLTGSIPRMNVTCDKLTHFWKMYWWASTAPGEEEGPGFMGTGESLGVDNHSIIKPHGQTHRSCPGWIRRQQEATQSWSPETWDREWQMAENIQMNNWSWIVIVNSARSWETACLGPPTGAEPQSSPSPGWSYQHVLDPQVSRALLGQALRHKILPPFLPIPLLSPPPPPPPPLL